MSSVGRRITLARSTLFGAFRRRPVRSLSIALFSVILFGASSFYGWAVYSWRQAVTDADSQRFEASRRRLDFCRRVWPNDPALLLLSAKTSRKTGQYAAAEGYLNRYFALRTESRDAAQLEFLLLRTETGDDEAADPLFVLVDQGHPQSTEILEAISMSYIKRLRYQAANACLSKWIELFPDQASPYDRRGWIYESTSIPALAIRDYSKSLELDPGRTPVRLRLVELLLYEKKVPEVAPHIAALVAQAPDRAEVKARVGMLRFLEGRSREARELLEGVEPQLASEDVAPVIYLARLDVQEGKGLDAERRLRRVIAQDSTETEARFVLVSALRLQGREAEAVAVQQEQEKLNERNIRVNYLLRDRADKADATLEEWFEIGSIFMEMRLESRGVYWLEKLLARDPQHQGAHREMMDHFERKGDAAGAAAHRRMLRDK